MKAGDNKEFWQRTAKSYRPLMKHSGKLYDAIKFSSAVPVRSAWV